MLNKKKEEKEIKKQRMVIGMVVFCFMMMTSGAAWCYNFEYTSPNGALFDSSAGLAWLKDASFLGSMNWDQAMARVKSLKSGECGLTDGSKAGQWRLPTKGELIARQKNQQGFNSVQDWYWSSTLDYKGAWVVAMFGPTAYGNIYIDDYVWPVRAVQ
jgi:hypothetical protein